MTFLIQTNWVIIPRGLNLSALTFTWAFDNWVKYSSFDSLFCWSISYRFCHNRVFLFRISCDFHLTTKGFITMYLFALMRYWDFSNPLALFVKHEPPSYHVDRSKWENWAQKRVALDKQVPSEGKGEKLVVRFERSLSLHFINGYLIILPSSD